MVKKFWGMKSGLAICVLIFFISGCGSKEAESYESIQSSLSEKGITLYGIGETTSQKEKNREESAGYNFDYDRTVDYTDYSSFLKKIWIVEDWDNGINYPISIVITQIEKGYIKGCFLIDDFIKSDYFYSLDEREKIPEFCGMIYSGTSECEYDYKDGRLGTLTITFCGNDRIEVELDGDEAQCFTLRPYNISDEKFLDEPTFYEVELDSWGTVTLFYANLDCNHPIPCIFLLNDNGDVIYEFNGSFHTGSEVLEIFIDDMNGDGMRDVEVVTYFPEVPDAYRFEWYFFQTEEVFFNMGLSNLLGKEWGDVW